MMESLPSSLQRKQNLCLLKEPSTKSSTSLPLEQEGSPSNSSGLLVGDLINNNKASETLCAQLGDRERSPLLLTLPLASENT